MYDIDSASDFGGSESPSDEEELVFQTPRNRGAENEEEAKATPATVGGPIQGDIEDDFEKRVMQAPEDQREIIRLARGKIRELQALEFS